MMMTAAGTIPPAKVLILAVAIAWSPATPAPKINTLAGGIVPAAVIIIGSDLENLLVAYTTDLYPAKLLCDDNISIDCALVIRGIKSRDIVLIWFFAYSFKLFFKSLKFPINVLPLGSSFNSLSEGVCIFRIKSAFFTVSLKLFAISAPIFW
jgi:hypothetical protein